MPKAQAIQINWQFTGSAGIMQVEHTADCFGGAWFKSPLSTEVWHLRHIWRETAFQFTEVLALNGETYVVSVNEFSAMCSWQVVGAQVEQNRCKDRALRKAVTLESPRTGVIAHVHPETDQCLKFCDVTPSATMLSTLNNPWDLDLDCSAASFLVQWTQAHWNAGKRQRQCGEWRARRSILHEHEVVVRVTANCRQ